jgi:membrane protease YdiL (CAAX protease family)
MAISTVTQQPITNAYAPSTSDTDTITIECIIQPRNFLFLIPTITGIAIGILFLPNFGLGLAFGIAELAITLISVSLLSQAGIISRTKDNNNEYDKYVRKSLLAVSLFGPIAEEGIFRGLIQPLVTRSIQILVPVAATALFGTGLSVATAVSIVATSVLFGAAHYFNPHKNAHIQAISTAIGGLTLGFLSAQFGIGASIAAHIAFNSIIGLLTACRPYDKESSNILEQRKFDTISLPT